VQTDLLVQSDFDTVCTRLLTLSDDVNRRLSLLLSGFPASSPASGRSFMMNLCVLLSMEQ
jgi:hypothetical protein